MNTTTLFPPEQTIAHLNPQLWGKINALHIRKIIAEFAHELLIHPELQSIKEGWNYYLLKADTPGIEYHFRAQILSLDHWHIDQNSIEKYTHGTLTTLDSMNFIIEFSVSIGIDSETLPKYLEEVASTLYGQAYMHHYSSFSSQKLATAEFQEIECAMMAGHPSFIANNGRIGFDAKDYKDYAPEVASPISLIWIAGHRSKVTYASITDLTYECLLKQELDSNTLETFNQVLKNQGLDPNFYYFIPVHSWQWFNKLVHLFASDIANQYLVCLGYSPDQYQAQQSIRTFFNRSNPHKFYVKMALSILNMGFVRGLSPYYMETAPAINQWVEEQIKQDNYLQEKRFAILREVATMGYRHSYYEMAEKGNGPYKKMLAALWRDNPVNKLQPGQRLMTMAALLHIDHKGQALLPELIKSSGMDTSTWLKQYLDCYLNPILHCFFQHDMVFMPHGENLILVLENNVPVSVFMKDIAEEVGVLDSNKILPANVERLSFTIPDEYKLTYIFTDIFDCFFRYLSHILVEHGHYPEKLFWKLVATCILDYQQSQPHLREKFQRYPLFDAEFRRCCLNRLQLSHHQHMVVLSDPIGNLKFVGTLKNPIATYQTANLELSVLNTTKS